MHSVSEIEETVLKLESTDDFNAVVKDLFHFQYENNPLYREFCRLILKNIAPSSDTSIHPFLPIRFFKSNEVKTGQWKESQIFTSSGTTGTEISRHYVKNVELYEQSFLKGFRFFYGEPADYIFLALLPSYLEREGSSLVYMCNRLIQLSGKKESGFFLNDTDRLKDVLIACEKTGQKTILIGVGFALLDLADEFSLSLKHTLVMETGGMKGRKKEITREELHQRLKKSFLVDVIHSEYGMTELFSQAYSKGNGIYHCPPQMKVVITALNDPQEILAPGNSGRINIIDLANIHSCAFIATDDLGKMNADGSFEVMGRIDNSDLRGCNLLIS